MSRSRTERKRGDRRRVRTLRVALGFVLVLGSGCGADKRGGSGPEIGADAVTQDLRWRQEPGSEVVQCHTFKLANGARIDVRRIQFVFGTGSHHVHVYRSDDPEPDGVTDCAAGLAWPRWKLLIGSQTEPLDWTLPDGLTIPIEAHQQLMIQIHWLNLSPMAVDESVQLAFYPAKEPGAAVGVMFGVNKQIAILPNQGATLHQECSLPPGSSVLAMMGHFHALGRRFNADVRPAGEPSGQIGQIGEVVYAGTDEATLLFKSFVPALPIPEGSQIAFDCEYFNFRDAPARWGADTQRDEHCNLVTYYTPAVDAAAFCVQDFSNTATLTSLASIAIGPVAAGSALTYTASLKGAVEEDTLLTLAASDPSALDAPPFVVIPAGMTAATFPALAVRPTRNVDLTATLGEQAFHASLTIGGLVLSEVFARAGASWIEIANLGTRKVDLSRYALGIAGRSYDVATVPLSGWLPASGCLLTETTIGPGGTDADGVALFDQDAASISSTTVPLDALVYGTTNSRRLMDARGTTAIPVATPDPGRSLGRRSMSDGWIVEVEPSPGICEVRW